MNGVKDSYMMFPEEMADLLIGFIILRHEKREISNNEAESALIEILDSYDKLDFYGGIKENEKLLGFGVDEYNECKIKYLNCIEFLKEYCFE